MFSRMTCCLWWPVHLVLASVSQNQVGIHAISAYNCLYPEHIGIKIKQIITMAFAFCKTVCFLLLLLFCSLFFYFFYFKLWFLSNNSLKTIRMTFPFKWELATGSSPYCGGWQTRMVKFTTTTGYKTDTSPVFHNKTLWPHKKSTKRNPRADQERQGRL